MYAGIFWMWYTRVEFMCAVLHAQSEHLDVMCAVIFWIWYTYIACMCAVIRVRMRSGCHVCSDLCVQISSGSGIHVLNGCVQ